MKKILIINSSIRKKSTYSLLKRIEALLGESEVEFVNIKDFNIRPCTGCENCLRKGTCPLSDDANLLLSQITSADGIIIGTPVYLRHISGYLKVLIDRACAWYHRPALAGKPVFFVTTTQVTGSRQAVRYLQDLSVQWGTIYAGALPRTMFNLEKELKKRTFSKFLFYLDDKNTTKYRPSFKQLLEFHTQKVLAVNILPLDLEYWREKGYIDKPYYYDCRITLCKRFLGHLYYKMLSYFIGKNKVE
ncbi:MAG: flavodoxin family protein [Spirochaetales bacterium]|nr:flavodoxin family protein [Spirochaetales bacterium]